VSHGQLFTCRLVHSNGGPRWYKWVWGLLPPPLILHHVVEPVLDLGEAIASVEVRFREWDVVDKVLEDWLLLIDRLCLSAVVVHVTFVLGEFLRLNNRGSSRRGH